MNKYFPICFCWLSTLLQNKCKALKPVCSLPLQLRRVVDRVPLTSSAPVTALTSLQKVREY